MKYELPYVNVVHHVIFWCGLDLLYVAPITGTIQANALCDENHVELDSNSLSPIEENVLQVVICFNTIYVFTYAWVHSSVFILIYNK